MKRLDSDPKFELIDAARFSEVLAAYPKENQRLIEGLYLPLLEQTSAQLINNVHVDIELLQTPARILGLVLPQAQDAHPEESYVASPYGQYVDYGRYETALELGKLRWLNVLANRIFDVLGKICRWQNLIRWYWLITCCFPPTCILKSQTMMYSNCSIFYKSNFTTEPLYTAPFAHKCTLSGSPN